MARLIFVVVVAVLASLSSANVVVTPTQEVEYTGAVGEIHSNVIPEERTDPDIADIQNADDHETIDQFAPECGPNDGYVRHKSRCELFYQCVSGIQPKWQRCSDGLFFDLRYNVCNWASEVDCDVPSLRRRVGRLSDNTDDAESRARCPKGFFPMSCEASNPRDSDGTEVDEATRECVAVNSARAAGQRAIAICASVDDGAVVYVTSGSWEPNPVAKCPRNYKLANCFLRNAWQHVRAAFPYQDVRRQWCSSDITCSAGKGCYVQAVCIRRF